MVFKKLRKKIESKRDPYNLFGRMAVLGKDAVWKLEKRRRINEYLKNHKIKKLHLGCGSNILDSWLNSDRYNDQNIISVDVTKQFPFDDSTFDYIFSEHLIEHLSYPQGIKMLQECFRILKPKGKIRMAMPDLKFLIELYNKEKTKLQKEYIHWVTNTFLKNTKTYEDTFVINNFFYNFNHKFIYDYKTIKLSLESAGFSEIGYSELEKSKDPNLQALESHERIIGEEHTKLETFVIEAEKT